MAAVACAEALFGGQEHSRDAYLVVPNLTCLIANSFAALLTSPPSLGLDDGGAGRVSVPISTAHINLRASHLTNTPRHPQLQNPPAYKGTPELLLSHYCA
jgi:hypothetical protein